MSWQHWLFLFLFFVFLQWLDKVVRKPALSNNSINNALYTNGCRTVEKKLIQNWQEIHRGDSRSSRDDQLSILVLKQKRHKDMKALTVSIIIIRINLFFSHLKNKTNKKNSCKHIFQIKYLINNVSDFTELIKFIWTIVVIIIIKKKKIPRLDTPNTLVLQSGSALAHGRPGRGGSPAAHRRRCTSFTGERHHLQQIIWKHSSPELWKCHLSASFTQCVERRLPLAVIARGTPDWTGVRPSE